MRCKNCGGMLEEIWSENPSWPTADNIYRCKTCKTYWLETFPKSHGFASILRQISKSEAEEITGIELS